MCMSCQCLALPSLRPEFLNPCSIGSLLEKGSLGTRHAAFSKFGHTACRLHDIASNCVSAATPAEPRGEKIVSVCKFWA